MRILVYHNDRREEYKSHNGYGERTLLYQSVSCTILVKTERFCRNWKKAD